MRVDGYVTTSDHSLKTVYYLCILVYYPCVLFCSDGLPSVSFSMATPPKDGFPRRWSVVRGGVEVPSRGGGARLGESYGQREPASQSRTSVAAIWYDRADSFAILSRASSSTDPPWTWAIRLPIASTVRRCVSSL